MKHPSEHLPSVRQFDAIFPSTERLPRELTARFRSYRVAGREIVRTFVGGVQVGQDLSDCSHSPDGYRFHDAFHFACAGCLGWSPVLRRNLGLKRRSAPWVDEVEDGGRAIVVEEAISAFVFTVLKRAGGALKNGPMSDEHVDLIRRMCVPFEVAVCTAAEWQHAIQSAVEAWTLLEQFRSGDLYVNLDRREVSYVQSVC